MSNKIFNSLFVSVLIYFYSTSFVVAHPLDEIDGVTVYDQKQSVEVTPESIDISIDLTFYAFEKIKVWESIDENKDQKISEEEKTTWMNKGKEASMLTVDNVNHGFEVADLSFPEYHTFFASGPANVSIRLRSQVTITHESNLIYTYIGKDKKLEEIEIVARGKGGIKVDNVEKLSPESVRFHLSEGSDTGYVLGEASSDTLNAFLDTYVKSETIPLTALFFAITTSFLLGALHALTPGHGKALVAGYLVGEKGTIWHAIQLGTIVTITHTASVFILGVLALIATEYIVPTKVISFLNTVSGVLIVLFGLYLLITRIKNLQKSNYDHYHSHDHPHSHNHDHEHTHTPSISFRSLLTLGVSGGIVPCIDALAILVVAISLQKIVLGLLLLIVFSLGLASTLVFCGILVVVAKKKVTDRISHVSQYQIYSGIFSATLVTLLGLLLIFGVGI